MISTWCELGQKGGKVAKIVGFSQISEDPFGTLPVSRLLLKLAFGVGSGAWLAGSRANGVG